jgi:hypothetical protein
MSRHWRAVSKVMQKRAAGLYDVKSEGMFPYETYYILATDAELERLYNLSSEHEHVAGANGLSSGRAHLLEPV